MGACVRIWRAQYRNVLPEMKHVVNAALMEPALVPALAARNHESLFCTFKIIIIRVRKSEVIPVLNVCTIASKGLTRFFIKTNIIYNTDHREITQIHSSIMRYTSRSDSMMMFCKTCNIQIPNTINKTVIRNNPQSKNKHIESESVYDYYVILKTLSEYCKIPIINTNRNSQESRKR